jgi:toxin-antitoxin system PIN domain toxin
MWMALALSAHDHRAAARGWLQTIEDPRSILFCRATQQSIVRLLTTAAVMARYGNQPLTNDAAWAIYEAFLSDDRIAFRGSEPAGLERYWKAYAVRPTASPKLWMDAYLAAFARAGGCRMVTTDKAFAQFEDLDLVLLGQSAASDRSPQ